MNSVRIFEEPKAGPKIIDIYANNSGYVVLYNNTFKYWERQIVKEMLHTRKIPEEGYFFTGIQARLGDPRKMIRERLTRCDPYDIMMVWQPHTESIHVKLTNGELHTHFKYRVIGGCDEFLPLKE